MSDPRDIEPWLPDLCRLPRLLAMLGLAEMVVVVLALAPDGERAWSVEDFLSVSGFALWLALAVTVTLCVARARISRLPQALGAALAIVLATVIGLLGSGTLHALYAVLGNMPVVGSGVGFWRFTLGSAATVALIAAMALRYYYVIDRWSAQLQANAQAQSDALQARIRPHFLFNSMNLIATLLRRDPDVAERAVLDLSDLFRAALVAGEGCSSLRAECELAERYLSIESLRLGDRLQLQLDYAEDLPWSLPMPQLVLQPLVENAVLHGISRLPEGGTVHLQIRRVEGFLQILIGNPAPSPESPGLPLVAGNGHAQRNIAHRLAHRFGRSVKMTRQWADGYYQCLIRLPLP